MRSPPAERRSLLIFEPDVEGHSLEWLQHLVAFAQSENDDSELWLVVSEPLRKALADNLAGDDCCVHLIALSHDEQRLCAKRPLFIAAFARWRIMRRYLRISGAQHGLFLMLDLLSLPLALGLRAGGARLSGILFRPSVHYREIGPYRPTLGERLRDARKALLYRLMLRNQALERVLSLDSFFPAYARAHYRHGGKVVALPDPAHPHIEPPASAAAGNIFPAGRTSFLLFGYLAERKGPLAVLDALSLLPAGIASRVGVLFAGKVDPDLRERLHRQRLDLARHRPELWLRIEDRRLDDTELAALVRQSDVVLAPYQRFVGSSGVLLWAALNGRPVLAQDYGLIGRLTRDHRLGVPVDACNPERIAREMTRMVEGGPASFFDAPAATRFAAAQTPRRFASLVLSV
jgi:glycosyltransferase involved in cell wall biosynthesis